MKSKGLLYFLTAASFVVLLVGGCGLIGPSEEEVQLEADCITVFENASATYEWADDVDLDTWPDTYAVTNAGTASRQKARSDINLKFPWIAGAVAEVVDERGWEQMERSNFGLGAYIEGLAINQLVEGTSLAPAFSTDELDRFIREPNEGANIVQEVRFGLLDPWGEPSALSECPELTSSSYVDGFEKRFKYTIINARQGAEQMLTILSCDLRGEFDGDECATDDFQVDWTDTPVVRRNPFEEPFRDETTQGLAEFAWCWDLGLEVNPDRTGCW